MGLLRGEERRKRMAGFLKSIFGDTNEKELKKLFKIAEQIDALDSQMQAKTDEELRDYTWLLYTSPMSRSVFSTRLRTWAISQALYRGELSDL